MADAREFTLALLANRAVNATICPSEVARAVAEKSDGKDAHSWRREMPAVHAAIDDLLARGLVRISWKGHDLPARTGPYRVRRVRPN
ncbi:DUF3253 domain-containing protein [Sphingomonas naphthae]|uniref:DUF3253 domain-containing protein n=1 Tax=Sphingomonas naphthae TaxID=1813468 RepID=A0ABY7TIM9_9SPHN|nr:DUF3253 domain-containing protein [Sphingomonas naphthae]WCT72656.1 DUF3253 domain-containing protein [Sphingomonas naphthae]